MIDKKIGENNASSNTEEKRMAIYLVVAEWYVLEKSLIQETICDAESPEQLP